MPFRPSFCFALLLGVAVSACQVGAGAWAQDDTNAGDANPRPLSDATPASSDTSAAPPSDLAPSPTTGANGSLDPAPADPATIGAPPLPPPSLSDDAKPPVARNMYRLPPNRYKLRDTNPNPKTTLPPLVPYRGAPGASRGDLNPKPPDPASIDRRAPAPTVAVIQSPNRPKRVPPDPDPYAATGVAAGELRLFPFVETTTGYESNPNQLTTGAIGSPILRVESGVDVKSNFSSNSLTASLRGGYSDYPSNSVANRPDASGVVDGVLDVTRDDKINAEARFSLTTQTPGSPSLAVPGTAFITNRPSIISEGATLGATHAFNRLSISLRGTFDRTDYGDGTESDGSIYRLSNYNFNDYGLVARATYELTPALLPFVEVGADSRVHDDPIDLSGYARNSVGEAFKVGSTFEFTRLLTGNAAVGYAHRHYDDPRLPDLAGPTIDGALVYTISPLTTATLRATTSLADTTLAGSSGAISRGISVDLAHALFRNLAIDLTGSAQFDVYKGVVASDSLLSGGVKATYSFTREVQLTASATHSKLSSTLAGSSFTDTIFLVGMRLQR